MSYAVPAAYPQAEKRPVARVPWRKDSYSASLSGLPVVLLKAAPAPR